jgi:hypothetical protein
VFLVWVIIGRVMPFFGLELLGMARDVADFNLLRRIMAPGRREKLRELLLTALTTDDVTKHSLALCAYTALGSLDWGEYTELANSATYANALDRFKEDELRPKFKKYRGIRDKLQTVEDIATELKTVYAALCGAIEKLKRKGENGKALSAQTGDVYMVGPTATGSVSTLRIVRESTFMLPTGPRLRKPTPKIEFLRRSASLDSTHKSSTSLGSQKEIHGVSIGQSK